VAHERRHGPPQPVGPNPPGAFQRLYTGALGPYAHLLAAEQVDDIGSLFGEDDPGFADFLRHRGYKKPLKEAEYKPAYTHPIPAEPGFTFDFAPDSSSETPAFPPTSNSDPIIILDDQEQTENKVTTVLVCARCQDPLVLNSGLTGSDSTDRKVWALRCGHMIDGKCLTELGQPPVVVDRKGKGRAKEEVPYGDDSASHEDSPEPPSIPEPEPNIRSRLRSHALAVAASSSAPLLPLTPESRKRKATKAKAAPAKKRKVEEEYEWQCPVVGCGKTHVSIKMDGVWGPEKERQVKKKGSWKYPPPPSDTEPRGAIAIFA